MPASTAIAVFAYRRPDHLRRTLEALARNPEARRLPLHVYCDGPRGALDHDACAATRAIAKAAGDLPERRVIERQDNLGLSRSIVEGVSETLLQHERIVVLEDDLVVSASFLGYTLAALDRYGCNDRVGCIHGYSPPVTGLPDHFFLRGGDCWGWATWRDRWALYRSDTQTLLGELHQRGLAGHFDSTGGSGMYLRLLKAHRGRWDSWAIRWHASLFLADRLCLHPGRSLVTNIGLDGSGTHSHQGATAAAASTPPGTWDGHLPEDPPAEDEGARKLLARHDRTGFAGLANAGQSWLQRQLHRRAFRP